MSSTTRNPEVIRISQKGQATIPKAMREKLGIETPGEVLVYDEGDHIVVEPMPSFEELGGIHADEDRERGEITERVRAIKARERDRETKRAERLRPQADDSAE